jgi:hypothetical protein
VLAKWEHYTPFPKLSQKPHPCVPQNELREMIEFHHLHVPGRSSKFYQKLLGPDHVNVPEELIEADLALLPEKERNKILNQRTRDAKKATNKVLREARWPLLKL